MKLRRQTKRFSEELISNAIGWIAGLVSVDFLSHFFAVRGWKNAWGLFSRKTMIDAETFSLIEWAITAIFGFIVLMIVNKLIMKRFFNKVYKENKEKVDYETANK